jgi:LPS-assembly protein
MAALRAAAAGQTLDLVSVSDKPLEFDYNTREMVVADARLTYGEIVLTADQIRYDDRTRIASARGNIVVTRAAVRLVADRGTYDLNTGRIHLYDTKAGTYPLYVSGRELEGNTHEFTMQDAEFCLGEPGGWVPTVHARSIDFVDGKKFQAHHARLSIGPVPIIPLPAYIHHLDTPPIDPELRLGYYRSVGAFVDLVAMVPVAEGVRVGPEIGAFSRRGVLLGPAARYEISKDDSNYTGRLRSGWLHDFGGLATRGIDIRGDQVGQDRGFIDFSHHQANGEHFTFDSQLAYWNDSEVVRDFARHRFGQNQQPETYLEANYAGDNYVASIFGQFEPNGFQHTRRREPEIRVDLLPSPQDFGVIQRGSVSFDHLRQDSTAISPTLTSDRFDTFFGVERPTVLTPWLTFTPVAGTRLTHYFTPIGPKDDYTRLLAEIGADLRARAYGQFETRNERWGVDGLRHLIEPFVQYRNIPGADKGKPYIPQIDTPVFATRLQPLGLGDARNIDDLGPIHTMRVGIDQRLQTRDGKGGSRDLAILTLAQDFRFRRMPTGGYHTSDLNADIAIPAAGWIKFDSFARYSPQKQRIEEFNSGLTFTDSNFWTARFGTQFLRDNTAGTTPLDIKGRRIVGIEGYSVDGNIRLNERFTLTGYIHYDARMSRITQQVYGLRQNFRNLWSIEYQIARYEGQSRENGLQFRVQIELIRF